MQLVISAFPGTGKSTISNNAEQYGLIKAHVRYDDRDGVCIDLLHDPDKKPVFDSDSSIFPKDNFPSNYIEHIKGLLRDYPECVIMVSSHDNVRAALRDADIDYILVYPQRELKGDYLERYVERGSPEAFVKLMDDKWNDFIDSCESDPSTSKRVLSEGEYLVDKIEELKKFWPKAATVEGNEAFPTAVLSGTESIGDIVCDAEGKPVAAWGANGLEPLPVEVQVEVPAVEVQVSPDVGEPVPNPTTGAPVGTVVENEVTIEDKGVGGTVNVEVETEVVPAPGVSTEEVVAAVVAQSPVEPDNVEVEVKPNGVVEVEVTEQGVAPTEAIQVAAETLPDPVDQTAAIFSVALGDNPAPEPTVAPAPAIVDLVQLNAEDIPVVAAVEEPTVAAVVVDNGVTTAEVVDVQVAPEAVPVSGEVIVDGQEDAGAGADVSVEVNQETGVVEVETPEGTVTVTADEVTVEGQNIEVVADDLVQTDADRADLIELKLDMQNDIDAIEPVVAMAKTEEHAGNESFADGSELLKQAASQAKETYGIEMEPTLAGLESFLDGLKSALSKVGQALKTKGSAKTIIKRTIADASKAAREYSSSEWQGKQEFINVGKTKVSTPGVFKESSSIGDVETIVGMIIKQVDSAVSKHTSNIKQRQAAGMKIVNQFKGKDPNDKEAKEQLKEISISPEYLKTGVEDSGLKNVDLKTSMVELPVLKKEDVTAASALLGKLVEHIHKLWNHVEDVDTTLLGEEDLYDMPFWNHVTDGVAFGKIWDAVTYDAADQLVDISYKNDDVSIAIAKFLERWILNSVK